MGFLDMFKGKSPEELERKGDELFSSGSFGPAKIEYEKALGKHEKKAAQSPDFEFRIKGKITESKETLAQIHVNTAKELIEADCFTEAGELLSLSKELSGNTDFISEVEKLMEAAKEKHFENSKKEYDPLSYEEPDEETDGEPSQWYEDEEYFNALLSALPEEEQQAYESYGDAFSVGYVALNRGDFPLAEASLTRALEENSGAKTFIPLELGTCYLNMGEYGKARKMLHPFVQDFPRSLKAYQVMCELLWEEGNYEQAKVLLDQCPEEISTDPMIHLLKGETLVQEGKLKEAKIFYQEFIKFVGRDELVLRALAGVYEMLGETSQARGVYGELLNACKGCGQKPDPHLKQRFAETSFEIGERTTGILELYLDLAAADPFRKGDYYARVSEIYSALGNENEALRFRAFSERELNRQ